MSQTKRIVHLKQSGELLTDDPGKRWTPPALKKAAERIAEVQRTAERLNVGGLMIVSGGGNVPDGYGRGSVMREVFGTDTAVGRIADVIGRRSTVDNAILLGAALEDLGVPHKMFAAPKSNFSDMDLGEIKAYDIESVQAAYREGHVVLMAGGIGVSNITTDTAVVELAMWQAKAHPEVPSLALKATKYNGVFDNNPKTHPDARQYARLSAGFMLADYERFSAVDERCLEILRDAGTSGLDVRLQVYAADYTIAQALQNEKLGTAIYAKPVEAVFV
jgi:uridylate kinase